MSDNKGNQELARRKTQALIRGAGTSIRKAEIKRQKLNAEANIDYAQLLQNNIYEDYKTIGGVIEETFKAGSESYQDDDEIEDVLLTSATALLRHGAEAMTRMPPGTQRRHIIELNNFIEDVINNIVADLRKEGIYLPRLNRINPEGMFLITVIQAKETVDRCVGILEGIIKASK